ASATLVVFSELHGGGPSWRLVGPPGARTLSLAGVWALAFSQPLFAFVLARWFWRLGIWGIFLRRVAGLDLALAPAHPDRAAGLGFLGTTPHGFAIVVFALSTVLAGAWGNSYLHRGVDPMVHRNAFIVFVVLAEIMLLAPLLAFVGPLQKAKHLGQ